MGQKVDHLVLGYNQITMIPEEWDIDTYMLYLLHNQITSIPENWNPIINTLFIFIIIIV